MTNVGEAVAIIWWSGELHLESAELLPRLRAGKGEGYGETERAV